MSRLELQNVSRLVFCPICSCSIQIKTLFTNIKRIFNVVMVTLLPLVSISIFKYLNVSTAVNITFWECCKLKYSFIPLSIFYILWVPYHGDILRLQQRWSSRWVIVSIIVSIFYMFMCCMDWTNSFIPKRKSKLTNLSLSIAWSPCETYEYVQIVGHMSKACQYYIY